MKVIKEWENATENLTKAFVKKYFPHEEYGKDTFWVCDVIGDVFCVSDYFFSIDRMREALELKATWEQLSGFYDYEIDSVLDGEKRVNFRNYIKGLR